jgi:hypothetical protein
MLERVIKMMVSDQGNGCPPILNRGRILKMSKGVAIFEFLTPQAARRGDIGLPWKPQPHAPPLGGIFAVGRTDIVSKTKSPANMADAAGWNPIGVTMRFSGRLRWSGCAPGSVLLWIMLRHDMR